MYFMEINKVPKNVIENRIKTILLFKRGDQIKFKYVISGRI